MQLQSQVQGTDEGAVRLARSRLNVSLEFRAMRMDYSLILAAEDSCSAQGSSYADGSGTERDRHACVSCVSSSSFAAATSTAMTSSTVRDI